MQYPFLIHSCLFFLYFFFNDTATTEIYTLSLHDALPIYNFVGQLNKRPEIQRAFTFFTARAPAYQVDVDRSEEHTSELQSQFHLVCRLLLEKKKTKNDYTFHVDNSDIHYARCSDSDRIAL